MENSRDNTAEICGWVEADPHFSHSLYGERFFRFMLKVPRLSDCVDILPITVSERLICPWLKKGCLIRLWGQLRSYNQYAPNANRLVLTIFARDIQRIGRFANPSNLLLLHGHICKEPIYRITPFKREISDLLLAVNRAYHKSDYIPCIAWGRNARFAGELKIGDEITIRGRMQSREYQKQDEKGQPETRIAYEVSIAELAFVRSQ